MKERRFYHNPPDRETKSTVWRITGADAGPLVRFLSDRLAVSSRKAKALLDERCVFVNRRRVWMARHPLGPGDVVEVITAPRAARAPTPTQPVRAPRVLVREDDYLVLDKPAGLLSNGPDSAETLARAASDAPALRAVHRLDRDTSGCLLMARSNAAFASAIPQFRRRRVLKVYHAIVAGRFPLSEQTIRSPLDGEPAATHVRRLDANDSASHLAVRIETGRTHQIRRHMARAGHPILGDRQYGTETLNDRRYLEVPRQMLHASELRFPHPAGDRVVEAVSPLPSDFRACLDRFGLR
jgi:23S rRNA pseudouridine1911/1915/1917 synthase